MSPRLRRVRGHYPREFVQLAVVLAQGRQKRDVSFLLGVPLSTVYRWLNSQRRRPAFDAQRGGDHLLRELVGACERQGVRVARQLGISQFEVSSEAAGDALHQRAAPSGAQRVEPAAQRSREVSEEIRRRLQLVRDKIEREYFTHLSCDEFGRIAAMSKFNLIHRFKRVFGVSPYRYLLQVRVRQARKLLASTPASLGAIASAVGFDSQSSLGKAFRSIERIGLSEFCHVVRAAAPAYPAPAPRSASPSLQR